MHDFTSGIPGVPRSVSPGVRIGIFFGYPLAFFGLVFFLFGSVFLVAFGGQADFRSLLRFSNSDPVVAGYLTGTQETNASSNKKRIHEYRYRYAVGGERYQGSSFDLYQSLKIGDDVLVQYVEGNPGLSRIAGMRAAPFGWWIALFAAVFPGIGGAMLYVAFKRYRQNVDLVVNGVVTTGTVIRKEATSTSVNKQTVYRVFFRFKSADGREHEACVSTHLTATLGDEPHEPLVYDPANPARAVLLDALPPKVRRQLAPGR